ncbi:MAG TPA: ABC transporter permease [Candidatus Limnocylindria bacterium]|jgi:ABC-2 type transport system permease protein|nr:ABC transporter permease [Candidatus Limnocylindria bacterium]
MSGIGLTLRQVRYENLAFWRNPAAAFFTFVFPLLFMVIFNVLFGGGEDGGRFFTPAIIVFSVITATFTNIAMSLTMARDEGILKRIRGTPLPAWAYLGGRILHAAGVALLLVVIVAAFGAVFYGVPVPWAQLPALLVTLLLGAATFCALGLAVSAFVPNADAAPAVVNAAILPLLFISNVFFPLQNAPEWINVVSEIFPVRHFADAMLRIYDVNTLGAGFSNGDLAVMAIWGVIGLFVAARFFSWEPRH